MSSAQPSPIILATILCDNILAEADGTVSAIRIIDKITVSIQPESIEKLALLPSETRNQIQQQPIVRAKLLTVVKCGDFNGDVTVKMLIKSPGGKIKEPQIVGSFTLKGPPEAGLNVITDIVLTLRRAGLHWLEVLLNDVVRARIPILIVLAEGSAPIPDPENEQSEDAQ